MARVEGLDMSGGYHVRGWEAFRERRTQAQIEAAERQRSRMRAAKSRAS